MKLNKIFLLAFIALAGVFASCDDDDDYKAGKPAGEVDVRFVEEGGQISVPVTATSFSVSLCRLSDKTKELKVPIKVLSANDSVFKDIPQEIVFAAGEDTVSFDVTVTDKVEFFKEYPFSLAIPEEYTQPYIDEDQTPTFNANVIKMMQQVAAEYESLGKENIVIYPIGRKVAEKAAKLGFIIGGEYNDLAEKPNAKQCIDLARELGQQFVHRKIDRVELIYHHFKSAGSQILTRKTFLPIDLTDELTRDHERDLKSTVTTKDAQEYLRKRDEERGEHRGSLDAKPLNSNFIVEPDMPTVLGALIPKMAHLMLYTALLDSIASEHAARMVAMQTATDNADELLRGLNLQYNKSRQQAITNELLDIVGGSVNN